jgi:leucyl aminopeptidase
LPAADTSPTLLVEYRPVTQDQAPSPLTIRFCYNTGTQKLGDPGKSAGDLVVERTGDAVTLWVSLGSESKATEEVFRKAGGAIGKWFLTGQAQNADVDATEFPFPNMPVALGALLEGIRLGAYQFNRYKQTDNGVHPVTVHVHSSDPAMLAHLIDDVTIRTEYVLLAREWAHEPANVINPFSLVERAQLLANETGLKCTVYSEKDLEEMKAGAILAVGKGSQTPSRLIVLEYPGKPSYTETKPIILVGKALTFDSGGYSIKDSTNIQGMKYDKCGGVTVLATLAAVARLGFERPVVGIIGAAENMISANAYRPDDIITSMSGKTIEIVSTDAEGRLVLADALTFAQQHYQPGAIIDLATLTGGVVVALGRVRAGIMSNNNELAQSLIASGERTSERLWQLPLDEEYLQSTKGDDADLKNSGGREGHAILGGIFLKQFVDDAVPWAHLDIAGVADSPKDLPYCPKGATGFGVRLLLDYLSR